MALIEAAGKGSMKLLTSRTFWIIVILVIVAIIIYRKSDYFLAKAKSRLGQQTGDWQEGTITEGRKADLETLAERMYAEIYSFTKQGEGGTIAALQMTNTLNDNELLYLARYYEDHTGAENSLWFDIDDEWLPQTSSDETLMARLSALGMK